MKNLFSLQRGLCAAAAILITAGAAFAAPPPSAIPGTTPGGAAPSIQGNLDIPRLTAQIENYMSGVDTVKARFIQTAPDGTQRVGTFYMDRPGKMRFEYDPPVRDMVVADGIQLFYYDGELKQTSSAPIGQTLADFLLRKNIKLSGDVRVVGAQEGGGLVQVVLTQKADPGAGTMTLGFKDAPFTLKKWRITDGQGQITEVELFDLQQNIALSGSLFVYKDPSKPQGGYNQ